MSWLAGCRRLRRRYARQADHFLAFSSIACALMLGVVAVPGTLVRIRRVTGLSQRALVLDGREGAWPVVACGVPWRV